MVGHQHKPDALGAERLQQMVEYAQHDSFRLVEIEQSPALVNREGHEEDVSLVAEYTRVSVRVVVKMPPGSEVRTEQVARVSRQGVKAADSLSLAFPLAPEV